MFWNGALHWPSRREFSLRFDVERELLLTMPTLPKLYKRGGGRGGCCILESPKAICIWLRTMALALLFDVLEMKSDYSGWFVKYHVDPDVVATAYPEMVRNNAPEIHRFVFSVLHLVRGGNGGEQEGSFLVLHIPGKLISYHLRNRTFTEICNLSRRLMSMDSHLGLKYTWENVHHYANALCYLWSSTYWDPILKGLDTYYSILIS